MGDRVSSDATDGLQGACRVGGKVRERHLPASYEVEVLGKAPGDRRLGHPKATVRREPWRELRLSSEAPSDSMAGPEQCGRFAPSKTRSGNARVAARPGGRGCDSGLDGLPTGGKRTKETPAGLRIGR